MKNVLRLAMLAPVLLAGSGQPPNCQADIRVAEMKALLYFDQDGTLGTCDAMDEGPTPRPSGIRASVRVLLVASLQTRPSFSCVSRGPMTLPGTRRSMWWPRLKGQPPARR